MAQDLSRSARRIQETLASLGTALEVVELSASTRTSADAAAAIGCTVAQIAKSIVFRTRNTQRAVMVIASGANRVNEKRVAEIVGEPVEKADADFVRDKTGFVIGGVPPVGHAEPILTLVDEDLLALGELWAAAGTPNSVFKLTADALVRMTGAPVQSIK